MMKDQLRNNLPNFEKAKANGAEKRWKTHQMLIVLEMTRLRQKAFKNIKTIKDVTCGRKRHREINSAF